MRDVPIEDPDPSDLGPAMLALTPLQRRFVVGWVQTRGKDATRVAKAAGVSDKSEGAKVYASRTLRKAGVIAAIKEEAERRMDTTAALALLLLGDDVTSRDKKTRKWAIENTLDRKGYGRSTTQDIRVEHVDSRSTAELLKLAQQFSQQGLLPAPKIIDVTPEKV